MNQAMLALTPAKLHRGPAVEAAARGMGDRAIQAGELKAAKVCPLFRAQAEAHILAYLGQHGISSGELMTDSCKLAGIVSTDDRHFGCVYRALLKRQAIRRAGECPRMKGHASLGGSLYALGDT